MHTPTIPFPEVLWYNTRYSSFFPNTVIQKSAWIPSQKRYIQRASLQAIKGFTDTISPPDQANLHAIRENQYPSSQTAMISEESNKHALV